MKKIENLCIFIIVVDYISETYNYNDVEFWSLSVLNAFILMPFIKEINKQK